jgi:hypothetical protein
MSRYLLGRKVDGQFSKNEAGAPMARRNGPVEPQTKEVTLQIHGHDEYGRTIGDVILPDGTNVNHELVKGGWR